MDHRVKDHPPIKNGYKTRFWCSQDEAHRSKSSRVARPPRLSSAGRAVAKARFPCRSRLLISCRDSLNELRIITIHMHHHIAHERYAPTLVGREDEQQPQPQPQPLKLTPVIVESDSNSKQISKPGSMPASQVQALQTIPPPPWLTGSATSTNTLSTLLNMTQP